MTDIVDRLRGPYDPYPESLKEKAADEIERLTAALKRYGYHDGDCTVSDPCCSYICDCGFGEAIAEDK